MLRLLERVPTQRSKPASVPPPVGGWNTRDAVANMDEKDAITLDNMFPTPSDVMVRRGYSEFANGLPGQVETLIDYASASGTEKLIAVSRSAFYDASSGGWVGNYINLAGGASDSANTPDAAALDLTGDFRIKANIAPASYTPAANNPIVAKYGAAGNRAWRLVLTPVSTLQLQVSADGTANTVSAVSSPITGFSAGQRIYILTTFDANDGAGGNQSSFYWSTTSTGSWNLLSSVSSGGTVSIFNSTNPLEIGASAGGIRFIGKEYSVKLYNGLPGTLVASFDANDANVGAATVTSLLTGEIYTLNGTAAIAGTQVVSNLSNARWQHVNFTNSAGTVYVYAVNGTDTPWLFDGTNWTTATAIGVTANNFIHVNAFKQRLFLVEKNTLKAWYLNTGAILGSASAVDLSGFTRLGGYLMAMGTWTIDAGAGVDDYAVFVTSKGEVLVFQGTDPTSSNTWAMKGRWELGAPIGRRCLRRLGGDLLYISVDGVVPLSKALVSSRVNPRIAITDKISGAMSEAAMSYAANFGWELLQYPKGSMLLLNVPVTTGADQQQYAMNTITGSWGRFEGIDANCWTIIGDEPYFGGNTYVGRFWNTFADNGNAINWEAQQAFNYFGSRGQLKQFHQARPVFQTTGNPATQVGVNVDYDTSVPSGTLSYTAVTYAAWDSAVWDQASWGGSLSVIANWQGISGIGVCAALHLLGQTSGIDTHWMATDYVIEPGGLGTQ